MLKALSLVSVVVGLMWSNLALAQDVQRSFPGCWRYETEATSKCNISGDQCIGLLWIVNLDTHERVICNRLEVVGKYWELKCSGSLTGTDPENPIIYMFLNEEVKDREFYRDSVFCPNK